MTVYRYNCGDCGKTHIGERPATPMTCLCNKPMIGSVYKPPAVPLSDELKESHSIGAATKLRAELCTRWGIVNKSHVTHGSNFSGSQTLAQLIGNICDPLSETDRIRVKALVIRDYRYDIDTMMMS